jgi:predicted kinase
LSPDEWIVRLYGADIAGEELDAVRDPVEAALWGMAIRVLQLGVDVILEYGFWAQSEREEYRRRAASIGARSELHFCDATEEELLHRLARRNAQPPFGAFRIEEERLRGWIRVFERPTAEELYPREVPQPG